uniref:BPTI/Kunitz inhibitor domain-containing protein n=1 Tax=Hyalomma excavatum TaxID=257692 RepID=A0A131XFZ7_9ACAR
MALGEALEASRNGNCASNLYHTTLLFCLLAVSQSARSSGFSSDTRITDEDKCSGEWRICPKEDKGYYYNKTSDTCILYSKEGDCGLYRHLFPSMEECNWVCRTDTICKLPLKKGRKCEKSGALMYYFDQKKQECDLFYYEGCDGNANRFSSVQECEVTCRGKRCVTPINDDDGICDRTRTTYHFYGKDGNSSCVKGNGCSRDGDNFKSAGDCQRVCILKPTTVSSTNEVSS